MGAFDEQAGNYRRWRAGITESAAPLSRLIATKYAALAGIGDFQDLPIDADALRKMFEAGIEPFDRDEFERYQGAAKATFSFYDMTQGERQASSALYSYWDPETITDGDRHYQRVTGSSAGYYRPDRLPDLNKNTVDLTVNAYIPDLGLCSYVSMYQGGRQLKASVGYKLPHQYEELWFVRNLKPDGSDTGGNDFMLSHEWKGIRNGRRSYFMTGIFLSIDFDARSVEVKGNQFWRALYEADPAASDEA